MRITTNFSLNHFERKEIYLSLKSGILQVGDLLLSINGESVTDRYYQSVIRMLHEAERLGEVELRIQRSDTAVAGLF